MLTIKGSIPAGGTGTGGNSAETLLPVTYTPMRGVGGSRDGGFLFAQNYYFLFFTLNWLSIVVIWRKVTLGRRKNFVYFLYFRTQGKRRFYATTVLEKALLRGRNLGGYWRIWREYLKGKKS